MIINLTFYSCGHAEARWVTYILKLILRINHPIYTFHTLTLVISSKFPTFNFEKFEHKKGNFIRKVKMVNEIISTKNNLN